MMCEECKETKYCLSKKNIPDLWGCNRGGTSTVPKAMGERFRRDCEEIAKMLEIDPEKYIADCIKEVMA